MRQRMTKAEIEQLELQIYEALEFDNPQSVRHVFYLMTNPRLEVSVPKSDTGEGNGYGKVQRRMVEMRRGGRLPYRWVTDATRRGYHVNTYHDKSDFLRSMASLYRGDVWVDSDTHVEVWCESRSIAGVIQDDCEDFAVSLYPAGGFSSLSLVYEAATYIREELDATNKRRVVVLYVGDYDPAGVLVDKSIEKEMRSHIPGVEVEFRRVGINADQVVEYDLPTKPRKPKDKRAAHVPYSVEAEAMPAYILRGLLRQELEAFIPARALAVMKIAEHEEREGLLAMANLMGWPNKTEAPL